MVALPNSALLTRGKAIFDEVLAGRFQHGWCPITLTDGVDTLEVMVSCDALKMSVSTIADEVPIENVATRVNVDAFTQQEIADVLDAVLLTPLLVDRIYEQSPKVSPSTRPAGSQMAHTTEMIAHSRTVDQKLAAAAGDDPLKPRANVGKDWVVTKRIFEPNAIAANRSANYGWLGEGNSRSVTGIPLWQSVGTAHTAGRPGEAGHTDYSQVARYAHRSALLNGNPVDLGDVYTGRAGGTQLVSHEGPLPDFRIPQAEGAPPPFPEPPAPVLPAKGVKKKDPTGRVIGGGIMGAGIGWWAGGPFGAAIGALIGGLAGGATK